MRHGLALAVALLLSGCGFFTRPADRHELEAGAPYWFDYAAERRGAILVPSRGTVRFCAEPSPDIALRQAVDLVAKAETPQGVTASGQAKFSADVIALAGRTQTILFLREALYRLCEQQLNGTVAPDQVAPLFLEILRASSTMAAAQFVSEIRKTSADKLPTVSEALAPAVTLPPAAPIDNAPAEPAQPLAP